MKDTGTFKTGSFQFIVLPNTGIQICRGCPVSTTDEMNQDKLWSLAEKVARRFQDAELVALLAGHSSVNRDIPATGWIPCSPGERAYFRVTKTGENLSLDLLVDTCYGAARQYGNIIPCGVETGLVRRKPYPLAGYYVEEHKNARCVRGTLLIDYGNAAVTSLFCPTGQGPFRHTLVCSNEALDPNYRNRSESDRRLLSSNLALLGVPANPQGEPWVVSGNRAGELVQLEPLCTYLFAPKKYVRYWPEALQALEPAVALRGVVGQRDGLHPTWSVVRVGIEHLLLNAVGTLVNPNGTSHRPEMYPVIERIMLTYPLTWREVDRELFRQAFKDAANKYLLVDDEVNDNVEVELICSEPVAVAAYVLWESVFHYGVKALSLMNSTLGNVKGEPHLRLVIVDIGGGSTDIAVVEVHWEVSKSQEVDVKFQMVEAMRFNRAGDRLSHLIVTSLVHYLRTKYGISETLDFEREASNPGFTLSYKRSAVSKLNELAEAVKIHLSQEETPWELDETAERTLLDCFEPLVRERLDRESIASPPRFQLDLPTLEEWIRRDQQSMETNGEPGFMDIFLFLRALNSSLQDRGRPPHAVVLSGRTTRLPTIKKLAAEFLDMPFHKVRALQEMVPLSARRSGHENPDKISVVAGAHRFRFGDHVRFVPLPEDKVFNRYIGSAKETPAGLKLNEILVEPGATPPCSVTVEVYPSSDVRLGHCFRRDGIAEVIAVLSNPSTEEKKTVEVDIVDDFTIRLAKSSEVQLVEWVPGGSDVILDNFNDTGKIDANPKDLILRSVIGQEDAT